MSGGVTRPEPHCQHPSTDHRGGHQLSPPYESDPHAPAHCPTAKPKVSSGDYWLRLSIAVMPKTSR